MTSESRIPDDVTLLKRIAHGDMQAFDVFYQRYSVTVYTYILRLVRDEQLAEDVLQETFIAVWRNAHQYRGKAQVRTWLFSIAHRRTMNWMRSKGGLNENEYVDAEEWLADGEATTYPSWEQTGVQLEDIRMALDQLSPEHRAVVELAFYYDLSYAEIAEVVGCPLGTVKSRLYTARQQLQHLLRHLRGAEIKPGGQR